MNAPNRIRLVSVSGGKDSTATLLLALETNWLDDVRAVFADTGNEHEQTLEYVDYLEAKTGIRIERVKADFAKQMAKKREQLLRIAAGESEADVYNNHHFKWPWTPETAARAAALLQPTGNPFVDLCMVRGGFPSQKKPFCSEELKQIPLTLHLHTLAAGGAHVESWQGVRADESLARSNVPDYEWGPIHSTRRPILRWGVERVFEQHRRHGIDPNPLYSQGMGRVGCMPCMRARKMELAEISRRFPEHLERIREMEALVGPVRRPMPYSPSFFHHTKIRGHGIDQAIRWSHTKRGGDVRQRDMIHEAEPEMCSSMYGLCE